MKKEQTKSPEKAIQKEEDRWINIHDDNVMREMGLVRSLPLVPRDENVWSKNAYERRIVSKVRHSSGTDMHFHTCPRKAIPVRCKLIVYLKKNKQFGKTTYSTECWQHEIPEILSKFQVINRKAGTATSVVMKYSWNGKTYQPNTLPFWQ